MPSEHLTVADITGIMIYTGWLGLASPPFHGETFRVDCRNGKWQRQRCDSAESTEITAELVTTLLSEVFRIVEMPADHFSLSWTDDHPIVRVDIHFKSGEFICAFSDSQGAGLVPWTIRHKLTGTIRKSGNPVLGIALAAVLPDDATNYSRLNSVFRYRSEHDFAKAFQGANMEELRLSLGVRPSGFSKHDKFDKRLLEIGWQESPAKLV